jgi:flagellar biosynthesis/type III secretory pathway M-ring protein FliF/YscJ
MNELKKTLSTLWTNLSLTQKASIFGSALAVFAVLIAVVYFSSQPKFTLLFANLPSEEASKVVEFLQSRRFAKTPPLWKPLH